MGKRVKTKRIDTKATRFCGDEVVYLSVPDRAAALVVVYGATGSGRSTWARKTRGRERTRIVRLGDYDPARGDPRATLAVPSRAARGVVVVAECRLNKDGRVGVALGRLIHAADAAVLCEDGLWRARKIRWARVEMQTRVDAGSTQGTSKIRG